MPDHLAGFFANDADFVVLGGVVILLGVYLVLRRILVAVRRRRPKPSAYLNEYGSSPLDLPSWVWERPVDLATEPSRSAVPSDPDVRPQDVGRQLGVRIEYFDANPEAYESSQGVQPNAFAAATTLATASPPAARRPIGFASRLGVATICLAVPLGYAMTRQNLVESAPAISQAQGHSDLSRPVELPAGAAPNMRGPARIDERTNAGLLSPDITAATAQAEAARVQAAAARELAGQEHQAVEAERARSAALQSALFESRKQIDSLRTSMTEADKTREERFRNELAAARAFDALRRIAGDAHTLLSRAIDYVVTAMPAAHLQRQRTERMARDLSQARAQIEQLEAKTAEDRAKAEASLAQASGVLDDERRKSAGLRGDVAEMARSNAALVERADAAERERTGAAAARERVEQTAAETAQALARERAAAASAREELKKARLGRDMAEQERTAAVSAKERAEQGAAEATQALARERAAAVSTQEDLNRARLERDAARALLVPVTRLNEALDEQREATVSLARDLATARADNDRLRAERRAAQPEAPLKPRSGRTSDATGQVKAVSQKAARSKVRNTSRVTRVRSITLPYSLWPRHFALD
ncbi:hypothetical protein [Mesorhizobium sp.]|uniref:hypothetical protein n=1 Tax=Mesorhizobium sp. TaxID=1871066 RepID=UPI0025C4CC46|nr:hypothetical protein [Mesorhizobium sp.]